jgi:hypothetical protein
MSNKCSGEVVELEIRVILNEGAPVETQLRLANVLEWNKPQVTCPACSVEMSFFDLLALRTLPVTGKFNELLEFYQNDVCRKCVPHPRVDIQLFDKFNVHFSPLFTPEGEPLTWYDKQGDVWRPSSQAQFRVTNGSTFWKPRELEAMKLTFQPYKARSGKKKS